MKVVMIGTGYVGLVSGACFADFGHQVTCIDKDEKKISMLKSGEMPFYEPGLKELVSSNVDKTRLDFDTDLSAPVKNADVIFIAVGTPSRRGDGFADLSYVEAAALEIAQEMEGFTVIVNKSTVPVGTGDKVEALIATKRPQEQFAVVSNPEFLREGSAISDFKRPDRIIVGTNSAHAVDIMGELYRPLFLNETPILYTDRRTSELTKYAANAFLATKITFINEMADLCEATGANVQQVAKGMGFDQRIGSKFLNAGPGYGGSCFPKDARALAQTAKEFNAPVEIVNTVIRVNEDRKMRMAEKIIAACNGVDKKRIAVLGLTFKPNTDDMREAPSLVIIPELQKRGANIVAFDPEGRKEAEKVLHDITYAEDAYQCIADADALVILTEWDQFRALDVDRIKSILKHPVIIDLRNIYDPESMAENGFDYHSIGRQ